jgi:phosphoenolpyruvate carboxylase
VHTVGWLHYPSRGSISTLTPVIAVTDAATAAPRTMSTQHPDNVAMPIFARDPVMSAEDEIREAYYAFSHLGCDEQMWDYEGKEVDNAVVQKLLSAYEPFFRDHQLGDRLRLTPRVPNPRLERVQAKGLLEVLQSLPRHADAARAFYGIAAAPPIYELIFPMTIDAIELQRIRAYYRRYVVGVAAQPLVPGDIPLSAWCGAFEPPDIQVIPLIEDLPQLLEADKILDDYLGRDTPTQQRAFIARSDPALNYGAIAAVLASLVALDRLQALERRRGVAILPIIGCGGAPFRGGLRPATAEAVLRTYPSVQTFTLQSAFKYDHPVDDVTRGVTLIKQTRRSGALPAADDPKLRGIIERAAGRYRAEVRELARLVNVLAPHVPRRRLRRLHIGLFGYSRDDQEISLPRAITFCAALYSIGLPPELLGFAGLTHDEWLYLADRFPGLVEQIEDGLALLDPEIGRALPPLAAESVGLAQEWCAATTDLRHLELARRARSALEAGTPHLLPELIVLSGSVRRFLG